MITKKDMEKRRFKRVSQSIGKPYWWVSLKFRIKRRILKFVGRILRKPILHMFVFLVGFMEKYCDYRVQFPEVHIEGDLKTYFL